MRLLSSTVIAICIAASCRAEEPGFRWPEDGAWALYIFKSESVLMEHKFTTEGTTKIALVGKEIVDGEDCRWIELTSKSKFPAAEKPVQTIFKGLVHERDLRKGKSLTGRWQRGWMKIENNEPQELTSEMLSSPTMQVNLFLSSPPDNSKHLDKRIFYSVTDKLECDGVTWDFPNKGGKTTSVKTDKIQGQFTTVDMNLTIKWYYHEKSPFGLVAARWIREVAGGSGNGQDDLEFVESGTGAKTQLPIIKAESNFRGSH
ncbi:MAG: hypothetical protein ACJ8C4_03070 [Gemmataceae bacterium]